jgi:uncharacterized protein (DUF697 family)
MTERTTEAYETVRRYWKWSAAAGFIPIMLLDVATVTGLQLKMIADIARVYEVPFSQDRAKAIVGALVGATTPPLAAAAVLGALSPVFAFVPVVGLVAAVFATPAFNAAATYALGRVFVQHFESGGTFLDMDSDKLREHFKREFDSSGEASAVR